MTDKPSKADKLRAIVEEMRALKKESGGMSIDGEIANENERPKSVAHPEKPNDR